MNNEIPRNEDIWNRGFDFFFERESTRIHPIFVKINDSYNWTSGFIAAASYCEHLLKETKGKSDIG